MTVLRRSQGRQVGFRLHHTRQWTGALSICLTNCWGPPFLSCVVAVCCKILVEPQSFASILAIECSIWCSICRYSEILYCRSYKISYKHMGWQWPKKKLIAIAWCSANKLRAASLGSWCWVLESWRSNGRDNIWRSIATLGKNWKDRTTVNNRFNFVGFWSSIFWGATIKPQMVREFILRMMTISPQISSYSIL